MKTNCRNFTLWNSSMWCRTHKTRLSLPRHHPIGQLDFLKIDTTYLSSAQEQRGLIPTSWSTQAFRKMTWLPSLPQAMTSFAEIPLDMTYQTPRKRSCKSAHTKTLPNLTGSSFMQTGHLNRPTDTNLHNGTMNKVSETLGLLRRWVRPMWDRRPRLKSSGGLRNQSDMKMILRPSLAHVTSDHYRQKGKQWLGLPYGACLRMSTLPPYSERTPRSQHPSRQVQLALRLWIYPSRFFEDAFKLWKLHWEIDLKLSTFQVIATNPTTTLLTIWPNRNASKASTSLDKGLTCGNGEGSSHIFGWSSAQPTAYLHGVAQAFQFLLHNYLHKIDLCRMLALNVNLFPQHKSTSAFAVLMLVLCTMGNGGMPANLTTSGLNSLPLDWISWASRKLALQSYAPNQMISIDLLEGQTMAMEASSFGSTSRRLMHMLAQDLFSLPHITSLLCTKIHVACWYTLSRSGWTFGLRWPMLHIVVAHAKKDNFGGITSPQWRLPAPWTPASLCSWMPMQVQARLMEPQYFNMLALTHQAPHSYVRFSKTELFVYHPRRHVTLVPRQHGLRQMDFQSILLTTSPYPVNVCMNVNWARVVEEFDLGNSHYDHQAVALQLGWKDCQHSRPTKTNSKISFDLHHLQRHHVSDALHHYQVPCWQADIEHQVDDFNSQLLQKLAQTCPVKKWAPKKPCIDSKVWDLRIQKLAARRGLKEIARRQRRELLRFCLTSWKQPSTDLSARFWRYDGWLICTNAKMLGRFYRAARSLKIGLKQGKAQHLQQAFDKLHPEAPASAILHELKKVIGPTNLRSIKQQTLPMIENHDGHLCTHPQQALETWIRFFQEMEGGQRVDPHHQRHLWITNLKDFQADSLHLDISDIPSLVELEMAYRHVHPHKATGPDCIDASLCAKHPALFARKTYSQLLKLYAHGQESLVHKGGRLQPIWKQKGPRHLCSAYRSVLISSHVGKSLHRCIRLHTAETFEHYLQSQQVGGKRGIPVTLGVHHARAFMRSRARSGRSVGLLFLDLSEAFYRVVRQLALGGPIDDHAIAAIGARLQLGPELLHALHSHLDEPSAIERAQLSPQLQQVLRALHTDTHFHVGFQTDFCRTTLGTRPGDCFADIVFSFLWARLLKRLEDTLQQAHILELVPEEAGLQLSDFDGIDKLHEKTYRPYLGPTWMDDTCITFTAQSASQLETAAGRVGSELLSLCDEFAMSPNLAKGKTELLLVFQGRGANQAKKKHFGPNSPGTFPILTEAGPRFLNVVSSYTHLGSTIHHRGDLRKEMRRRFGIAHGAFNRHRRLLFQNQSLTLNRRRELFRTLILSKLLYGAESWTFRDQRDRHYLHSALMRLYSRLLPHQDRAPRSDEEILALTGLPDPATLLRLCRLRHLGLLYKCKETACWGLLNDDHDWTQLVRDDVIWMHRQLVNTSTLPDPHHGFPHWEFLMQHHPNFWKRLLRRAVDHDAGQRHNTLIVTRFHQDVLQILHEAGRLQGEPPHAEPRRSMQVHACMQCERQFASKGGCGAHLFRVHGKTNPVRRLFAQTHCGACLKEYHTFSKLKAHLLYSTRCRQTLQGRRVRWNPAPGAGSTVEGELTELHDGLLPPLQAQGPLIEAGPLGADIDYDLDIIEELYVDFLELNSIEECEQAVRKVAKRHAVSWSTFQASLAQFLEMFNEEDAQMLRVQGGQVRRLLGALQADSAWSFLTLTSEPSTSIWHRPMAQLEEFCRQELEEDRQLSSPPVPRSFDRERYILHLFAGRRRRGDFQFYVDSMQHLHADMQIHVLSIDIVIDDKWGDLANEETRQFWLRAIFDGHIVALIGGPPCETWSRARGKPFAHPGAGQRRGPRIIRTLQEIWGMSSLSLRELAQVKVGNLLMGFQLVAMAALSCTGGVAVLEHPATPPEPEAASIWRTPIMQLLLQLPGFEMITLAQGLWGAQTAKPTTLAILNAPELRGELHAGMVTKDLPGGMSIGRDATGQWATAKLKEYPPGLCRALARGILKAVQKLAPDFASTARVSSQFRDICTPLICTEFGSAYGPDYAGWVFLGQSTTELRHAMVAADFASLNPSQKIHSLNHW